MRFDRSAPLWRFRIRLLAEILVALSFASVRTNANEAVGSSTVQQKSKTSSTLPFTAGEVTRYFQETLMRKPATTADHGMLFKDWSAPRPEQRYRIAIHPEGSDVVVEFTVCGDHGMNLAREFFESPLFNRHESESLYRLLGTASFGTTRSEPLGRFNVSLSVRDSQDFQVLTLRFKPNQQAVSGPHSL